MATLPDVVVTGTVIESSWGNDVRAGFAENPAYLAEAAGDLFVASGAGEIERLAIGDPGRALVVNPAGDGLTYGRAAYGVQSSENPVDLTPGGFGSAPFVMAQDMVARRPVAPSSVSTTEAAFDDAWAGVTNTDVFDLPSTAFQGLANLGDLWYTASTLTDLGYELSLAGVVLDDWTPPGSPRAAGMTVLGGSLWYADAVTDDLYEININGSVISSFAVPGNNINSDVAGQDGDLWIVSNASDEMLRLSTAGVLLDSWAIPEGFRSDGLCAYGANLLAGSVVAGAPWNDPSLGPRLWEIDLDGNVIREIYDKYGSTSPISGMHEYNGDVYIVRAQETPEVLAVLSEFEFDIRLIAV